MAWVDRVSSVVTERSRLVIVLFLVLTLGIGAGAATIEESNRLAIDADSETAAADDSIAANFAERDINATTSVIAVRNTDGNALSRASLLRELEFQRELVANESVNETLVADQSGGVANVVATTAIAGTDGASGESGSEANREDGRGTTTPSLEAQIDALESMSDEEVAALVAGITDPDGDHPERQRVYSLLPREYEPGSATADARLIVLTQETEKPIRTDVSVSETVAEGQIDAHDIAQSQTGPETYLMVGSGLVGEQENAAIEDSLAIVGPLAVLFVIAALSITYRDPLDVVLGLVGVALVLVWTFGTIGWAGIAFNQLMVAIPILLVGLSVDYSFHAIMRYREEYGGDGDIRDAMDRSLRGVGPALALVTITTAIGFLANLTSPATDLQQFGIVAAIGIVATLLIFGLFVPACKVELDRALAARGFDRSARAVGTGGRVGALLGGGSKLARRAPVAVVVIALLVTAGGVAGAAQLETSADDDLYIADDPPAWTAELPDAIEPGEYSLHDDREYIYETFRTPDQRVEILIEGDVTEPSTLERLDAAESEAADAAVTIDRPMGEPAVDSPLSAMERTAADDEAFNETFDDADTDGDGVPDRNLESVYDAFFAANPSLAGQYVHRTDEGYAALRLGMGVDGTADVSTIDDQVGDVAAVVETDDRRATPTGQSLVAAAATDQLITTVFESIAATFVGILGLLTVVFRATRGRASLGIVTLVPVTVAVSWLFGTLSLLEIPISMTTAIVGSIALGLGVDYAIHVTERFADELEGGADAASALHRTVVGTGGALLSSAVTTAAGFGVLGFALLPALRQFGVSLALGIVYAFVASVVVLPSLLACWVRYGPGTATKATGTATPSDD
ncbi:efflux RND transporter permease subunit [Natrinema salaciae]|nr:MMPL family transporter [Natrinema salaciae]